jgi:hypothetical protein
MLLEEAEVISKKQMQPISNCDHVKRVRMGLLIYPPVQNHSLAPNALYFNFAHSGAHLQNAILCFLLYISLDERSVLSSSALRGQHISKMNDCVTCISYFLLMCEEAFCTNENL